MKKKFLCLYIAIAFGSAHGMDRVGKCLNDVATQYRVATFACTALTHAVVSGCLTEFFGQIGTDLTLHSNPSAHLLLKTVALNSVVIGLVTMSDGSGDALHLCKTGCEFALLAMPQNLLLMYHLL